MEPASTIIELLGGLYATADKTGVGYHAVKRWRHPKSRGGTDGFIPREHQFIVHACLLKDGHNLTTEEVIYSPEQRAEIQALRETSFPTDKNLSSPKSAPVQGVTP